VNGFYLILVFQIFVETDKTHDWPRHQVLFEFTHDDDDDDDPIMGGNAKCTLTGPPLAIHTNISANEKQRTIDDWTDRTRFSRTTDESHLVALENDEHIELSGDNITHGDSDQNDVTLMEAYLTCGRSFSRGDDEEGLDKDLFDYHMSGSPFTDESHSIFEDVLTDPLADSDNLSFKDILEMASHDMTEVKNVVRTMSRNHDVAMTSVESNDNELHLGSTQTSSSTPQQIPNDSLINSCVNILLAYQGKQGVQSGLSSLESTKIQTSLNSNPGQLPWQNLQSSVNQCSLAQGFIATNIYSSDDTKTNSFTDECKTLTLENELKSQNSDHHKIDTVVEGKQICNETTKSESKMTTPQLGVLGSTISQSFPWLNGNGTGAERVTMHHHPTIGETSSVCDNVQDKCVRNFPAAQSVGGAVATTNVFDNMFGLNRILPGLPFSLPTVPTGYRLVITHQSLPSSDSSTTQQVTQIVINHHGAAEQTVLQAQQPSCEQPSSVVSESLRLPGPFETFNHPATTSTGNASTSAECGNMTKPCKQSESCTQNSAQLLNFGLTTSITQSPICTNTGFEPLQSTRSMTSSVSSESGSSHAMCSTVQVPTSSGNCPNLGSINAVRSSGTEFPSTNNDMFVPLRQAVGQVNHQEQQRFPSQPLEYGPHFIGKRQPSVVESSNVLSNFFPPHFERFNSKERYRIPTISSPTVHTALDLSVAAGIRATVAPDSQGINTVNQESSRTSIGNQQISITRWPSSVAAADSQIGQTVTTCDPCVTSLQSIGYSSQGNCTPRIQFHEHQGFQPNRTVPQTTFGYTSTFPISLTSGNSPVVPIAGPNIATVRPTLPVKTTRRPSSLNISGHVHLARSLNTNNNEDSQSPRHQPIPHSLQQLNHNEPSFGTLTNTPFSKLINPKSSSTQTRPALSIWPKPRRASSSDISPVRLQNSSAGELSLRAGGGGGGGGSGNNGSSNIDSSLATVSGSTMQALSNKIKRNQRDSGIQAPSTISVITPTTTTENIPKLMPDIVSTSFSIDPQTPPSKLPVDILLKYVHSSFKHSAFDVLFSSPCSSSDTDDRVDFRTFSRLSNNAECVDEKGDFNMSCRCSNKHMLVC